MTRTEKVKARLREARDAEGDRLLALMEQAAPTMEATKTEGGESYPREAYAYAPDPDKPSEWKLRLWESPTAKVTVAQLGRAAAAFSPGGFRGQKVQLPADAVAGAKAKIRAAYKRLKVKDTDIPASIKEAFRLGDSFTEYLPVDGDAEPLLEAWVTISGTYEATIADLRKAVRDNAALFGADEEHAYCSVEGTRPGQVVVSGRNDSLYSAVWARGDDGAIVLSNVQPVTVSLRAGDQTIPTGSPAATPPPTPDVPASTGRALGMETELVETFRADLRDGLRVVTETTDDRGDPVMTVECRLTPVGTPTKNGRVYTQKLADQLVAESTAQTERARRWLGEQDHPADGYPRLASTVTTPWRNLHVAEGWLRGETTIIPTAAGLDVQKQIRYGVPVQVSSRTFATTKRDVRDGKTVEVVDETSALEHWGGWDFVLGAGADGAGVTSFSERVSPAADPTRVEDDAQGEIIDEVLEQMTLAEFEAKTRELITAGLKPVMETLAGKVNGDGKPAEGDPAAADAAVATETKPVVAAAPTGDVLAKVEETMARVNTFISEQEAEKKAGVTTAVLTETRKAIMERPEIAAWNEPARKFLDLRLSEVTDPVQIAPTLEQTQRHLTEMGMIVINGQPTGRGLSPVHDALSREGVTKERAKLFQLGQLRDADKPRDIQEAIDLLTEGLPDNGLRSSSDPEDPIVAYMGRNLPFPGYHPGNEKHQFRVIAENMLRLDRGVYFRPHLHPDMRARMEWTGVAAVAQTVPYILPIIRQVWARLIARELCSVQPMNRSTGIVHFLNFLYDPSLGDPAIPGQFQSEYAQHISEQSPMREVKLTLSHSDITMDTKKLRAEWSTEVRQNILADFGLNIASEMVNFMADEIAREVNALLLNVMRTAADPAGIITAGNINYGTAMPLLGYTNHTEWERKLYQFILRGDGLIRATRRARANWVVAGQNALIRLMSLQSWVATTGDPEARDWEVGLNLIGTIQGSPTLKVYGCDADFFPTDLLLLGRKGPEWPDAGTIFCPFIPLYVTTPFVADGTFCESESAMSRFGYAKVVGNCYATVTTQPGVVGVDW